MQTILVVEDDKNINEVVAEYLKADGFVVLTADDGQKALDIIEEGKSLDMFILDIMLPKITGLSLLKTIRETALYEHTPVMMLTAVQDEYTQILSFEELSDDYVIKPFSPKILVKRVQALLRRKISLSANLLQNGAVTLDLDSYQAYENEQPVKLTLREFELLKLFMQSPGRVFTRQQLLDASWGYDYFGDERIVDVHIKNLRKKFKASVVATVKGVGYKGENQGQSHGA